MTSTSNWVGSYNDPIYGGYINLCVTENVEGKTYAQAAFSELGYMRGTLSKKNIWTGVFFTSGLEAKRGNFTLNLLNESTLSGLFYEEPGINYEMVTSKINSETPSDLECMKTDADLLIYPDSIPYYTGQWLGPQNYGYQQYQYDSGTTAIFSIGNAFGWHPVSYLNNQVSPGQWYTETANGIELFVVKNATHFYLTYWSYERVADFHYNTEVNNSALHVTEYMNREDPGENVSQVRASVAYCQMMPTEYTLNSCLKALANSNGNTTSTGNGHSGNSGDDDYTIDDVNWAVGGAVVGALFAFALGFAAAYWWLSNSNKKGEATVSSNDANGINKTNGLASRGGATASIDANQRSYSANSSSTEGLDETKGGGGGIGGVFHNPFQKQYGGLNIPLRESEMGRRSDVI